MTALYIRVEDDGSNRTLCGIARLVVKGQHYLSLAMTSARKKTCMICGLTDGHTLINCPYKCVFCGNCNKDCDCINSSLADKVLDSETPEKNNSTSKRKVDDEDG